MDRTEWRNRSTITAGDFNTHAQYRTGQQITRK